MILHELKFLSHRLFPRFHLPVGSLCLFLGRSSGREGLLGTLSRLPCFSSRKFLFCSALKKPLQIDRIWNDGHNLLQSNSSFPGFLIECPQFRLASLTGNPKTGSNPYLSSFLQEEYCLLDQENLLKLMGLRTS